MQALTFLQEICRIGHVSGNEILPCTIPPCSRKYNGNIRISCGPFFHGNLMSPVNLWYQSRIWKCNFSCSVWHTNVLQLMSHSGTLMYCSLLSHSGTLMYCCLLSHSGTLMYCNLLSHSGTLMYFVVQLQTNRC